MMVITKEGMFCIASLEDMSITFDHIFELFTDSQSGRDIVVNQGATKHTVHFERWLYYVREMFLKKKLKLTLVTTEKMRADDKTKVVHKTKFIYCRMFQMNLTRDVE